MEDLEVTSTPEVEATPVTPEAAPAAKEPEAAEPSGLEKIKAAAEKEPAPGKEKEPEPEEPLPAAAYKPREKFKVMVYGSNEQKEIEVPEYLKPLMKDEKSEKEIIELLEKSHGLEPVKAARAAVARERDHFKGEFSKVQTAISDMRQTYQRGDIDAFLNKLQIPHERMLQWALDKVNYSQLPPDQQRVLDERQEAKRLAWAAEERSMSVEQQMYEQGRQAKQTLLESSLARPDVKTFAETFDARAGRPGAFFEEIKATGQSAWNQSNGKVDLTPDQAIEQVMVKYGPFLQSPVAQSAPVTPTAAQAASQGGASVIQAKPAVIPNVQGRTTSPMKSGPRSLDDLRKLGKQAQGA